jgi:NAD(P)-dependent dehydrogenase (short-subunit alcohol dehydrogenase family)
MDLQLHDRVALLVGGAGTIGHALAEVLREEGARAVVADIGQPIDLKTGQTAPIDVTDEESVKLCIKSVMELHGRIDILVTLAGVFSGGPLVELASQDWDRVMNINLRGTFLVCREVLPHMQAAHFGRIICIGSLAGQVGGIVAGADYAASKAGVLSLVKSLAKQAEKPGITVNAVNPGPVEGAMTGAWTAEARSGLIAKIPAGRFAQAHEIADLVAFLASPRAGFIHGAHLDINGGVYMD